MQFRRQYKSTEPKRWEVCTWDRSAKSSRKQVSLDLRDKRKRLKNVKEGNLEITEERPGNERRLIGRCLSMLSAVYKSVQRIFYFALDKRLASDTAEIRLHS